MENKRPTLNDPEEFALIREMYFDTSKGFQEDVEPTERLERMNSKQRNLTNNAR